MKIKCPHCGSAQTAFVGQHDTSAGQELTFRCVNPACNSQFSGLLTLTRSVAPGVDKFSADKPQQILTDV
ncbi:MAG: ogr/Delta-like zinc finger family protein [Rhodocyclaceae bacterium]|jgi:transcriptional regulator NrdR family protein